MRRPQAIVGALVVLIGSLSGGPSWADDPGDDLGFDFGRPTDEQLIEVRYFGGMVTESPRIAIYGDGRVHVDIFVRGFLSASDEAVLRAEGKTPVAPDVLLQSYETRMETWELEELLSETVRAGLLRFDESRLRERREALRRSLPRVTDTPGIEIRLDYSALFDGDPKILGEPRVRIVTSSPRHTARAFPEIAEYGAIWRLIQRIDALDRKARAGGPR
jgi:hypothetical protein